MEIYVLRLNRRRLVFHAEPVAQSPVVDPKAGWRSWIEARWAMLQARLRAAEGRAGALLRKIELFLKRFESPDEPMLRALRLASSVEFVHPTGIDEEHVRRAWAAELRRQSGNQLLWLVVNSIVGPIAVVLLAILPGPNLIGYWFVYRAVAHAMAWTGVKRALRGSIPSRMRAEPELDAPLRARRRLDPGVIERLEHHCGLATLRGMLERKGWLRGENADPDSHDPAAGEPRDIE